MRRRIVIGLLAAVVISIVTILVLQPKQGSVEWHQRQYSTAANRLAQNRFIDRLRRTVLWPTKGSPAAERKNAAKIEEHRKALALAGVVSERQFALKYRSVDQVKVALANTVANGPAVRNGRVWISTKGDTMVATAPQQVMGHFSISEMRNTIVVTGPREVIANCEEQIRKADVQ